MMAEAEDEGELSLEEQFAQILYALMRDDVSAAAAIQAFDKASAAMMQQYRCGQAGQQQCKRVSCQQQSRLHSMVGQWCVIAGGVSAGACLMNCTC